MDKIDIRSLTLPELQEETAAMGLPKFRAGQIYSWLHQKYAASFDEMTNISKHHRQILAEHYTCGRSTYTERQVSADGTVKYLFPTLDGQSVETGLSVHLNDFIMETYPNGMPKRFASDVVVRDKSGADIPGVIDVNKPMKVDGWKMYQYDYDSEAGVESRISVLQLVKDPWLPFVFAGIFMMLAGAFVMMIVGFKKEEK
jgi:cytochrome c biogenesis protein ResB